MTGMTRWLLIALVWFAWPHAVEAHPLDIGYLVIDPRGGDLAVELDLDLNVAARLLASDPAKVDVHQVAAASYREQVPAGCTWLGAGTAQLRGRTVHLVDRARCSAGTSTVRWRLPWAAGPRVASTFQLLVKQNERVAMLDRAHPEIEIHRDGGGEASSVRDFVWTGIEHIGAAPSEWRARDGSWKLPDGIDHILFLLALILAGGTLLELLALASGFTLGHSISLAIAAFGIARPPPGLIEPLIALTIVIAAVEALRGRGAHRKRRWLIAAAFGLIHGFGFATALAQLDLSGLRMASALFGYNLGVELGQLAIVCALAPALLALKRWPRAHALITRCAAAMVAIAGAYWFVQRLI